MSAARAPLLVAFFPSPPSDYFAPACLPACSEDLKGYLSSRFTLRSGDRPHLMKF